MKTEKNKEVSRTYVGDFSAHGEPAELAEDVQLGKRVLNGPCQTHTGIPKFANIFLHD